MTSPRPRLSPAGGLLVALPDNFLTRPGSPGLHLEPIMSLQQFPLSVIAALWRVAAAAPSSAARNSLFWECVQALESQGFAGNARRILERLAPWAR